MDEYLIEGASYERLVNEWKQYGKLYIAYDFDNTVYDYHKKGHTYEMVISLLRKLKKVGFVLICWTGQKNLDLVQNYLYEKKIPVDGINTEGIPGVGNASKPHFSALLDDRAGLLQVYEDLNKLINTINESN